MRRSFLTAVGIAALALSVPTVLSAPAMAATKIDTKAQAALQAMQDLNLIVLGNYSASSDVEGKAWVGGNLTGTATIGLGNSSKKESTSTFSSLTVGGTATGTTINLNNGATANGTSATGAFGVTIVGDAGKINFNGDGSVSKIGGNLQQDTNIGAGSVMTVSGYAQTITGTGATTIKVGSVQGGNSQLNGGNGSTVTVHSGGVNQVSVGDNSTVQVGGSVTSLTEGASSTATVTGAVGQNTLSLGSNSAVYAASMASQNVNGFSNGANVYINGSNPSQNGTPTGWHFNQNNTLTAPAAPAAPTVDVATMKSNMSDLVTQLASLTINSTVANSSGQLLFTVGSSASTAGFATFKVNASDLFSANGVGFNLNGYTGAIVVDVVGVNSLSETFSANAANSGTWNSSLSSQIIWNFVDATAASSISFNTGFEGSVLNPLGTISNSNYIEGSVVAGVFNQGGEVHLGTFDGGDPSTSTITTLSTVAAVPDAHIWVTMIIGFGIIGSIVRRQKQAGVLIRV